MISTRIFQCFAILASLAVAGSNLQTAQADLIYELNSTASFSHTSTTGTSSVTLASGSLPPSIGSADVGNGIFSWGSLSSDTSLNTAAFAGSSFAASDWGGIGRFVSDSIDVASLDAVTIDFGGSSVFNSTSGKFFRFFYKVDGGTDTVVGSASTGDPNVSGTLNLNTSAVSTLNVGFEFSHNGGSETAVVNSLSVSAVPEPSSWALLCVSGIAGLIQVRRRRNLPPAK